MTAQASDSIYYNDQRFFLKHSQKELFTPAKYGYKPVMSSTACIRGYIVTYEIVDNLLTLQTLYISHRELSFLSSSKKQPPNLNNVQAEKADTVEARGCEWGFEKVNLPINYTGGLVFATDFIQSLYIHIGFQDVWKYNTVIEGLFRNGELVWEKDQSESVAALRKQIERSQHEVSRAYIKDSLREIFQEIYKL